MSVEVRAPVSGVLCSLEDSSDPIFSMGALGWGVALDPPREAGSVLAPMDGKIERIRHHVFSLALGRDALIVQVGIKTEEVKDEVYTMHSATGDEVRTGDAIISWDPAKIEAKGLVPMVLVVAIDRGPRGLIGLKESGQVEAGDLLFTTR